MQGQRLEREAIAMRVARELQDGDVVNLGIGIPTLCSQFVPEGRTIMYHSESACSTTARWPSPARRTPT